jgi:hypothetical protein
MEIRVLLLFFLFENDQMMFTGICLPFIFEHSHCKTLLFVAASSSFSPPQPLLLLLRLECVLLKVATYTQSLSEDNEMSINIFGEGLSLEVVRLSQENLLNDSYA